ncbi:transcriptional regulator domain-containing protein [Bradyrhizobium sacchari]
MCGNSATPDCRSDEAYSGLKKPEAADLAWELLRRESDYQL